MKNTLALYYQDRPAETGEFNTLLNEMENAIRNELTEEEEGLIDNHPYLQRILTLDVVAEALGVGAEYLSSIHSGSSPVSKKLMRSMELLHGRVTDRPDLARKAILDYIERKDLSSTGE